MEIALDVRKFISSYRKIEIFKNGLV